MTSKVDVEVKLTVITAILALFKAYSDFGKELVDYRSVILDSVLLFIVSHLMAQAQYNQARSVLTDRTDISAKRKIVIRSEMKNTIRIVYLRAVVVAVFTYYFGHIELLLISSYMTYTIFGNTEDVKSC